MEKAQSACQLLKQVKDSGGALIILTGAGMNEAPVEELFQSKRVER